MKKNETRGYIIDSILFVVFTVIAFAAPFSKTALFWLGYVFGIVAIAAQIYFFRISFAKGEDVKSKFYGFPIAKIGVVYLAIQLIVSLIEMVLANHLPAWVAVILNVIILAIAAIGSITADIMRDEIAKQDSGLKQDVTNMRALQSLSASLVGLCQDTALKAKLQDLADEFKYSDPVSSDNTKEQETELKFLVGEIQRALVDGDLKAAEGFVVRVKSGLAERNRICKLNK